MEHSDVPQGLVRVCKMVGQDPEVLWTMQPPSEAGQGPMCEVVNTPERVEQFNAAINDALDRGRSPEEAMQVAGDVILGFGRPEMPDRLRPENNIAPGILKFAPAPKPKPQRMIKLW